MFVTAHKGFVLFSGSKPGNHATMFGPKGEKLSFRSDMSSFDDAARTYTWGFEYEGEIADGDLFVFATADYEEAGRGSAGEVETVLDGVFVEREKDGKPHRVIVFDVNDFRNRSVRGDLGEVDDASLIHESQSTYAATTSRRSSSARILAIFPGVQSPGAGWGSLSHASANNESAYMAHGMSYISSYLKSRGHQVQLLDTRAMSGWAHFIEEVRRQDYDYAMLGPLSIEAFTSACIVRILKEVHPRRPVIFGGLHVSMTKDKVFPPDDLPHFYFYGEPPTRMQEYLSLSRGRTRSKQLSGPRLIILYGMRASSQLPPSWRVIIWPQAIGTTR